MSDNGASAPFFVPRQSVAPVWMAGRFVLDLAAPRVMGIVNLTPDSFSDGGAHRDTRAALAACERLVHDGADLLDLGAESSRPGAPALSLAEELDRLLPVLRGALTLGCPISVDTYKAEVMRRVLGEGADILNDIFALRGQGALDVAAAHPSCGVCLMHMQGRPESMQREPNYDDVVSEVREFLDARGQVLCERGISPARIVFDPGIGFGKRVDHNLALLRDQAKLLALGRPLLVGWSRKSTLGVVTGRPVHDRQSASTAAALAAVQLGAKVVRVHDVAATVDALRVWRAAGLCA